MVMNFDPGVDEFQVDDVPIWERMWGAGDTIRYVIQRWMLLMGGAVVGGGNSMIHKSDLDRWGGRG